jgi:hypothetical protein
LEGQTSTCVGSASSQPSLLTQYRYIPSVENVHEWDRQNIWLLGTGKIGDVSVERDVLRNCKQSGLVIRTRGQQTFSAAAAFATAKLTPRMALAPNFPLFGVPSSLIKKSSIFCWSLTSIFSLIRAGPMISLTLATALVTPLPAHLLLSPSRSSTASCWPNTRQPCFPNIDIGRYEPVEAPDGTIAR